MLIRLIDQLQDFIKNNAFTLWILVLKNKENKPGNHRKKKRRKKEDIQNPYYNAITTQVISFFMNHSYSYI